MGDAARFRTGKQFRSFTGLVPKASETGDTDRKGQAMSKAGSSLLRTTLVRAADHARRQDPQLARIYYVQMVERGKDHLGALCVVAANLAERTWAVMRRGMPYVICDTDGRPVDPRRGRAVIAAHWTVPAEVRGPAAQQEGGGRPPRTSSRDNPCHALEAAGERGDLPPDRILCAGELNRQEGEHVCCRNSPLDNAASIGNQPRNRPITGISLRDSARKMAAAAGAMRSGAS